MTINDRERGGAPEGGRYDAVIIGAGPGGLQAAIYLGRYNRNVLIIDRGGGRTQHARHIENYLSHLRISGTEIVERGLEQVRSFKVAVTKGRVTAVRKEEDFRISTSGGPEYSSSIVVVSSGVSDNFPPIKNLHRFLGVSYFTCVDCDGYRTTGKKLCVIGVSLKTVNLAVAMKQMYTKDVTFFPYRFRLPDLYADLLREEQIAVIGTEPVGILGSDRMEALELADGARVPCEAVMASFGFRLNDDFLSGLGLKKDPEGFKYVVNRSYESSLAGLYIVGPLNTGNDQAVIAAGEGAVAAIDGNKKLLELKGAEQ